MMEEIKLLQMSQSFLFTIRLGFPSVIQIPPSQSLTENNIRLFFGKVIPLQNTVNHPVYIKLIPYSVFLLYVIPILFPY